MSFLTALAITNVWLAGAHGGMALRDLYLGRKIDAGNAFFAVACLAVAVLGWVAQR